MPHGWTGKILRVELTRRQAMPEDLNVDWARQYVGGRGLGTRYLYEEMDATQDALSPENKVIFATGPLTGTYAPTGGRYMVICKSPLTGAVACSNSGGYWGPELKFPGYDMVIPEGRSPEPVYLWIQNDHVEIRDASHLWGKNTEVTEDTIRTETDPQARISSTPPPASIQSGCATSAPTPCLRSAKRRCTRRVPARRSRARTGTRSASEFGT